MDEILQKHRKRLEERDVNYGVTALPIFLCLDASASMQGNKIDSLNRGVKDFIESGRRNEDACDALMIDIVSFNGDGVREIQPLTNVQKLSFRPLTAKGGTPFGAAVNKSLDLIEEYLAGNRKSYKPYLVVMSDGEPTDSKDEVERAVDRAIRLQEEGQVKVRSVSIGHDSESGFSALRRLNLRGHLDECDDLNISDFFEWLSSMAVEQSIRSLADQDNEGDPILRSRLIGTR